MHFPIRILCFSFLFFSFHAVAQQSGWDLVEASDFVAARAAFTEELNKNPQDEAALAGMLFCAETVHQEEPYERYANTLIRAGWQPQYVWLFSHLLQSSSEELLHAPLPVPLRIPAIRASADSLMAVYQSRQGRDLLGSVLPDWNWSIIGPFDNMQGSGFMEPTPVETDAFDTERVFKNDAGSEFKWLQRRLRQPGSSVTFDLLPHHNGLATFYASTFLTVPAARRVQLGIRRNTPMKIWLDDQLLSQPDQAFTPDEWDGETLVFDLPAGTHRLLVKLSEFPEEEADTPIELEFAEKWSPETEEIYRDLAEMGTLNYPGKRKPAFQLRLADPVTGLLFTDITSDYTGRYTPAQATPVVDYQNRPYLQYYIKQAADGAPWHIYLLSKAFLKSEAREEAEAFFATYREAHPESAFARYLLAKCFDANGKGERAEALLSEMDTVTTPTFAEYYNRFQKINKDQEEVKFVSALEKLLGISPSNWEIMNTYLDFLKEKGRKEQVKNWVNDFLKYNNTEKWKKRLEIYLKEESYRPESFKPMSDKQREKRFKTAKKALKKQFSVENYSQVIDYYKYREQEKDVLTTYDEMIAVMPWSTFFGLAKARYLFEKEHPAEALVVLTALLQEQPYAPAIYELMGDIAIEQKNEPEALLRYRQAEKVSGESARYSGLRDKVEKLDNSKKYSGFFRHCVLSEEAKNKNGLTNYADEDAVVQFYSVQNTYLKEENKIESVRKAVIRILSDAGAKNWTEADLRQIGQITSAKVLKNDGSITSPELGYGMAVFKNLQAGDVILVEGTGDMGVSEEISGDFWDLQIPTWQAPVLSATVELLAPADLKLQFAANRVSATPFAVKDTGDFKLYSWNWQHIPKMEAEEAAPETYDNYAWLMMGNMEDWSPIVRWYERQTYRRTEPNYEVLEKARQIITPGMTEEEMVEALHTFVVREISYSYVPFLNNNYVPKRPGETISGKVGDCKDVATLMISLLRSYGIPAWYTLVSTHSFSNRDMRPVLYAFNHAIVAYELKDKQIRFADLTTDYFPTGILPADDSYAWALIIRPGEKNLRRLPNHALDPVVSRIEMNATATIDAEGNLQIDIHTVQRGTSAGHWREMLKRANAADRRKLLSDYFSGGVLNYLDLNEFEFENLDSINAPLKSHLQMTAYNPLDRVHGLFIMPMPLPLSTPTQKVLFSDKRYNDIDLDALFELTPVEETIDLVIPDTYRLVDIPSDKAFNTPFGTYLLRVEKTAAGLRIRRAITFTNRFVEYRDFQELKNFYLRMLEADDSLLALEKKDAAWQNKR
ncbi:MAG TPA: transglutaminase domain-containing protein [Saprospiraceae bacterium]|nr:transglutaminase domain-containing protein [Saprospiraceae bacterium]HPI05272.1 transglutaminase domain-containing protein [Saprospiraceae bacterium]